MYCMCIISTHSFFWNNTYFVINIDCLSFDYFQNVLCFLGERQEFIQKLGFYFMLEFSKKSVSKCISAFLQLSHLRNNALSSMF